MKLFDQFGREVDTGALKEEQSAPTAVLRSIYSNLYPSTGLDVNKLTVIHRQADFGDPFLYLELAEEMEEKDQHYLAVLNKRRLAASSLELNVESGGDDAQSQQIAEFVRAVLFDPTGFNLRETLFDIMDALGKGFSVNEIIWNTERRMSVTKGAPTEMWWVPERLESRDPRWFMFDWISGRQVLVRTLRSDGQTLELKQQIVDKAQKKELLPHQPRNFGWNEQAAMLGIQPMTQRLQPYKYVVHFGRAKSGLPIRAGFARCVSWAYLFKNFAVKDWATFAERFGQPIRVGKYPAGATQEDRAALLAAVSGLGADTAGVIPQGSEITFESARGLGQSASLFKNYLEYLESLISKLVLGSTLGTQLGEAGSKAAAEVHRGVEMSIILADGDRLGNVLTRDLIKPLVDLNFGPQQSYPVIKIGIEDDEDSRNFVENVTDLADRGMPIGVDQIYDKIGLVPPKQGEALLTAKTSTTKRDTVDDPSGKGIPSADPDNPVLANPKDDVPPPALHARTVRLPSKRLEARHAKLGHPSDVMNDFAERLKGDWQKVSPGLISPVIKAVQDATGYDDLISKLGSLAQDMDPKAFREQLAMSVNAAYLAGRLVESDKGDA